MYTVGVMRWEFQDDLYTRVPVAREIYAYIIANPNCSLDQISKEFNIYTEVIQNVIDYMLLSGVWFIKNTPEAYRIRLWSAKNQAHCCVNCYTIKVPHEGEGLCRRCHGRERKLDSQYCNKKKEANKRWYQRVKDTVMYKIKVRKNMKAYRARIKAARIQAGLPVYKASNRLAVAV